MKYFVSQSLFWPDYLHFLNPLLGHRTKKQRFRDSAMNFIDRALARFGYMKAEKRQYPRWMREVAARSAYMMTGGEPHLVEE